MSELIERLRAVTLDDAIDAEREEAADELERLHSVETSYLARGLTIDSLTEQNAKLTRELAEALKWRRRARDLLSPLNEWDGELGALFFDNWLATGKVDQLLDLLDEEAQK